MAIIWLVAPDSHALLAQIIPVLLLALIVDTRLLARRPDSYDPDRPDDPAQWNVSQAAGLVALTVLVVIGECAALLGATGASGRGLATLAVAGLLAALGAVVVPVVARQVQHWRAAPRRTDDYLLALFVVVSSLLVILQLAALVVRLVAR